MLRGSLFWDTRYIASENCSVIFNTVRQTTKNLIAMIKIKFIFSSRTVTQVNVDQ